MLQNNVSIDRKNKRFDPGEERISNWNIESQEIIQICSTKR